MAGLLNNSNTRVLTQWHQLFSGQRAARSAEAYTHWQDVERLGLPTRQHEHWKYTPLDGLLVHRFVPATARAVATADRDVLDLGLDACRLVFVDGHFAPALSDSDTGVWHVEVEEGAARKALPAPIQPEVFLHLTESLSQETTRIRLPAGKSAQRPLYLLHISQGSGDQETLSTLHYRHHLDIGASAHGQVIEHFVSMNAHGHFSGARTSMVIGDNAHLSYIKLAFESRASYHFGHNDISVGRDAVVCSSTFILGAGLTRHQTSAQLNGEGSNLSINSLLLPSGQDISDTRTYLEHNKGYCLSRQLHKVIARDRGKGVFNGLIKVAKHALKTDGQMINNNLLLDRLSEVNAEPQMEIYADDVKCNHGATVGRIDQEQMFYLRSRGITHKDAQKMIIYAFAAEVTETIGHDGVHDTVLARITDALQGVTE
ncbi:cysteine desulfurase [Sodalis-like endosymbiont of Proechinophthirus fluctus]|uniref:Fe-S cluster assembly protein SufD n=1 Tax=Sodalis-like endosymbiont of Proechinophthirus fluctus TaxID=1462730 RepID=UPI0007A82FF6|nr:Fe-S cluster assembly protein SufD [Sodalis-like endosymbiont of Proechinophthirus fluctus]KYP97481.1 cysteine desulfurase [Sodalis-like endosymbiont of Proechinophthirus fluctus]